MLHVCARAHTHAYAWIRQAELAVVRKELERTRLTLQLKEANIKTAQMEAQKAKAALAATTAPPPSPALATAAHSKPGSRPLGDASPESMRAAGQRQRAVVGAPHWLPAATPSHGFPGRFVKRSTGSVGSTATGSVAGERYL